MVISMAMCTFRLRQDRADICMQIIVSWLIGGNETSVISANSALEVLRVFVVTNEFLEVCQEFRSRGRYPRALKVFCVLLLVACYVPEVRMVCADRVPFLGGARQHLLWDIILRY